jgi:[protein-PII] uridylyltransferase
VEPDPEVEPDRSGRRGASLRARRDALLARHDLRGPEFCHAYSRQADEWLNEVLGAATGGDTGGLALVAVGGYGRGELSPGSDLDVVLVHRRRKDVSRVAEAIWYPVWDEGVDLDHSVRTPREMMRAAEADLKVALGLLDARLVAGDPEAFEPLATRPRALWRSRARRWLPQLAASLAHRHQNQGDLAFLLEPDLKEAHGGLRDLHALRAAALGAPVLGEVVSDPELSRAADTLLRVRVELQRPTARRLDRLLLQEQDRVAEVLGFSDADELMSEVAEAGRALAWTSDDAWRRVDSWLKGPRGIESGQDVPLGPGVVLRDGEVALSPGASVTADPVLTLRVAAAAAETGAVLSRACLDRLAAEATEPATPWPEEARRSLVSLLGAGPRAVPLLEALDHRGVLVRLIPEWAAVRNRPQRNAYHRFTVDRHLLEAAANAASFVRQVARPDLLLVGCLLHDIGKGYPGDHTAAGITVVEKLAPRLGFDRADTAILVSLVRHHLLLADTATRRDLDDPATIESVASAVGDRATLELLAALTKADSLATGPAAWGPWKEGLVDQLVERVGRRLAGEPHPPQPSEPSEEHLRLMAERRLILNPENARITVVAPDRPGLLALVAGVLALNGLDVLSASAVSSADGMAVEEFDVEPAFGGSPDWDSVRADLEAAQDGRLALEPRLAERDRTYGGRRRVASARPVEVRVLVDNEASVASTVVEVRAPDSWAVLHRIASALADRQLDVVSAKVSTLGSEVVDAFYVRDGTGSKITDPGLIELMRTAVLERLAAAHPIGDGSEPAGPG